MYRIKINSSGQPFVTGLDATGRPLRWCDKRDAAAFTRPDAETTAQRLADYLLAYPTAGKRVAAGVRVVPATGGFTHWRPKLS